MTRLIARFDNRSRIIKKTSIVARDGEIFRKELHVFFGTFKESKEFNLYKAEIIRIARASFPFWTDLKPFELVSLPRSNALSIILNSKGQIVGFNLYKLGFFIEHSANFLYADYVGVDPIYRGRGLWHASVAEDLDIFDPEIFFASSAVSELHLAVKAISIEKGRIMYPLKATVPSAISVLGIQLYGQVKNPKEALKVEPGTLVKRNDRIPFNQGMAPYPLFLELKMKVNDGIIVLSLSRLFNNQLLGKK